MRLFKNGIPNLPVWITEIGIVQHDDHFAALLEEHTASFGLDAEVLPARCRIHHPFTLS